MAIPFLNNVTLNNNEIQNVRLQNGGSPPLNSGPGQIYYDSSLNVARYYDNNGWLRITDSSVASGTFVSSTSSGTNSEPIFTVELSATGTPSNSTFLRGDNVWATPAGQYTSWTLDGDTGTPQAIADGNTATFVGGTGIDTAVSATDTLTITNTGVTSIVAGSNISISGSTGAVTISATGDLTGIDAGDGIRIDDGSTATPEVNVQYTGTNNIIVKAPDLEGTAINTADLIIYGDSSSSDAVKRGLVSDLPFAPSGTVSGVTAVNFKTDGNALNVVSNTITSSGTMTGVWQGSSSQYVNGEGDLVTFPNIPQGDLTGLTEGDYISISNASGPVPTINALGTTASTPSRLVARDASGFGYVDTPSSGDSSEKIATTAFVQSALTRLLEFKGGFNASTGILDDGSGDDLYTDVVIEVGDYYIVTTAGNFFGNTATPLTVGDSVIAQNAVPDPGTTAPVEADFIVVQSDTDLATNSTPGLMFINPSGTGISSNISSGQATLTNTDKGSSQNIFKNVASDSGTAVADNNNDTLTIAGGTNVTTSVTGDTLTITSIDTNTQRGAGVGLSLNGNNIDANVDGTQTVAANSSSTATGRTYNVQVDSSNDLVVNVPWVNTTSGGTVTSVSASHEGNAFTVSVGSSTTTPAIDIDVVGSSSQYINGEGNLVTFPDYTAEGTISAGSTTGSVNHSWGTEKVIVQTYLDSSTLNYPTVYCDITRASNSVTATIATAETDDIVILVQKIG